MVRTEIWNRCDLGIAVIHMSKNGSASPVAPGAASLTRDLTAGLAVFLVALPLCLGIALASNAPLFSGLLAGIIGGILVGIASGSHTSVSGPAAGLAAVVVAEITSLGSFEAFLVALVVAGLMQIALGIARAGLLAEFFPSSVIKGLLAAIGLLLILKEIPHLIGHDTDPTGEMAFIQLDHENTFSELARSLASIHPGAALIGLASLALLILWDKFERLKKSAVPAPLFAVLLGVAGNLLLGRLDKPWTIEPSHLVQVPVGSSVADFFAFLHWPDFSQLQNPALYTAAFTIAAVASLETLLNLEAVDNIDPRRRTSPPNRELLAQGIGNTVSGLIGGLPVTSVIVRSSVNINAGGQTKLAAIFHGVLLLVSVALLPTWLNAIPLSCLAAILIMTGVKLASPALVKQMWSEGRYQFIPFLVTVVAIVLTDLLIGILIGLAVSIVFILASSMRRPVDRFVEKHIGGDVFRIVLANQMSFLNRAALIKVLNEVPRGGHVLFDAQNCDYIDPDILDLLREFSERTGPARAIEVSRLGFRSQYDLKDQIQFIDYSTRDLQRAMTPDQVLHVLKTGHERFRTGHRLHRDLGRLVSATAGGQHPFAVILGCIDSRTPAELIFDLGVGDAFIVRIAGNITSRKVLGSVEYACAVAGAKLILVMGHTRCGAVAAGVDLALSRADAAQTTGCEHLDPIVREIQESMDLPAHIQADQWSASEKESFVNEVARRNVLRSVLVMRQRSQALAQLVQQGRIAIVGAMYDVTTGDIEFLSEKADAHGRQLGR
jgi:carbonic anhydrase/SulP family sulfate permease